MAKRTVAVVIAAIFVGASVLLTGCGSSPAPNTAPPAATVSPSINTTPEVPGVERKQPKFKAPIPNFASLSTNPADAIEMFGRLTIPHPNMWGGSMSEDWSVRFVDGTTCTAASAECPHVTFYNQGSPEGRQLLGKDPVKWWKNQPCVTGTKQKVEGPVSMKLGGQSAKLYRVRCGKGDLVYNYAWYVPGKKLFVTGSIGSQGSLSVETIQAALERASWTS